HGGQTRVRPRARPIRLSCRAFGAVGATEKDGAADPRGSGPGQTRVRPRISSGDGDPRGSYSRRTTRGSLVVTVRFAMALLSLRGAAKSFGSRQILEGLDFDVEPGARVGVIGPNGGGKSTLLRILAGRETVDAGELTLRRGLVLAFLPQQPEGDDRDALATARAARPDLHALERELADVESQLAASGEDLDRIARLLRRQ